MEVEVRLSPFVVHKDCVSCFLVCFSGKFSQSGLKKLFSKFFMKKTEFCHRLKYLAKILAKKLNQFSQ